MFVARWQIDAKFGHKQKVIELMQRWDRDIGRPAGTAAMQFQLLSGSIGAREATVAEGLGPAYVVAAGASTCAADVAEVRCLTENRDLRRVPVRGARSLAADAGGHACAVTDKGEVFCWNSVGDLKPIEAARPAISIAANEETFCAVRSTGAVVCCLGAAVA